MSPRRSPGHAEAVGDGVLVALAAARQILKNLLIVRALRDGLDFDRAASLALAADAIVGLADEQEATADRLAERMHGTSGDRKRLLRRRAVVLDVGARLRELALDDGNVATLLDDARDLALAEIAAAAGSALAPRTAGISAGERATALTELRDDLDDLLYERSGY